MNTSSRVWELIARDLFNELNEAERLELEQLLVIHPEIAIQLQVLKQTDMFFEEKKVSASRKEQLLLDIINTPSAIQPVKRRINRWMLAAAIISGVLVSLSLVWTFGGPKKVTWSKIQTRPGTRYWLTLPDGSSVVLNAGSELSYPDNFQKGNRQVKLTGEAYFNIAKDANAPFVIHTPEVDVKVLGTELNLKAYPGERKTETSLISGAVEVTIKNNGDQKIVLKPNQKITVENHVPAKRASAAVIAKAARSGPLKTPRISLSAIAPGPDETAWIENRLVFRDETFEDLALRIERFYGVTFHFSNEKAASIIFSGTINGEPLPELLKILQQIHQFEYNITNQQVNIY